MSTHLRDESGVEMSASNGRLHGGGPANVVDQFRVALMERDILPPSEIIADGRIHRCDAEGKNGRGDGAYLLHLDGIPAGGFENHRDGRGWENWRADLGRNLSPNEERDLQERIAAQRQQREQDSAARVVETKCRASAVWNASTRVVGDHPYFTAKGIEAHNVRLYQGDLTIGGMSCERALVVPMRDADGEVCQLQFISPGGEKRFLPGPKPPGLYFSIGAPSEAVCIAEGYATAASIHEATGLAVAVAFDCGNLEPVARAIRAKQPQARIVVCADDDYRTDGNPGITKATAAARAIGAALAVPDFGIDRPDGAKDFNDLHRLLGPGAVKCCVEAAAIVSNTAARPPIEEISRAISRRMSDVIAQPIKWLWPGRVARGKVTILAGHPGLGKSQVTANLAATVTTGGRWPDGSRCDLGTVLMVSGEDDAADTIRPRLEAAGADLTRVHILDAIEEVSDDGEIIRRVFNLKLDLGRLESLLSQLGDVRMLSIDPITAYLGGTDSHKNADVRALLAPLADLAGRYGAAIIGVSHLSKAGGQKALLRVSGSLAFVAAARAAYLVASDEEEEGRRLMLPLKNNIGPDQTGFSFKIEAIPLGNGIDTSRVAWDSTPVTVTADDVLSAEASQTDDRNAIDEAKDFLCEVLAHGPVEGKLIYRQADDAGHSKRTIDRAKRELGIRSTKASMTSPWRWEMPAKVASASEDSHEKVMAVFENVGNLRPQEAQPLNLGTLGTFDGKGHLGQPVIAAMDTDAEVF